MPVSRKRKKKGRPVGSRPRPSAAAGSLPAWPDGPTVGEVGQVFAELSAQRERLTEHRAVTASASGDRIVADLVASASGNRDADLEARLCALLGDHLRRWKDLPILEAPDSDALIGAVVTAAAVSVREALAADATTAWQAPWQALVTVAGMVPYPFVGAVDEAVDELRGLPGGDVLPPLAAGPAIAGSVQWVRDAYGSRFGVVAPIDSPGREVRWYLWDVDSCAHSPITVYAGYHDSPDQALADWRAAVGPVAAGAATLTDVDDLGLVETLLEREYDYRAGPASQCDELVRSRRLAELATRSLAHLPVVPAETLDTDAAAEFTAWLREHHPEQATADGAAERVQELADSWFFGEPRALLGACSPHRVAHAVLHLHNYYQDDFADELTALMPHWTAWLSERNGTPPELAARCHPYALGETHPDVGADNSRPIMGVRVVE